MRVKSWVGSAALAGLLVLGGCSDAKKSDAKQDGAPAASQAAAKTPKAGLWEIKTTAMGVVAPAAKVCIGEAKQGDNPFVQKQAGADCAKNNVTETAGGYDIDMECKVNGMTVATKGSVTGDFSSAYKVEMETKMSGANIPASMQQGAKSVVDAKYLGACPDGMKPNEVKMN